MAIRKLSEPTTKTTVRLFTADIERANRLFPKLGVSRAFRMVFRNHLTQIENAQAERRAELLAEMEQPDAG